MASRSSFRFLLSLTITSFFVSPVIAQTDLKLSTKQKIVDIAIQEWQAFAENTALPSGIIIASLEQKKQIEKLHLEQVKCQKVNKYWNTLPSRRESVDNVKEAMKEYYTKTGENLPAVLPPGTSKNNQFFDTCAWPKKDLPNEGHFAGMVEKKNFWDLYPWSAAFISYVFTTGDQQKRFPAAVGHSKYISRVFKESNNSTYPFKAIDTTLNAPKVGDLICASRNVSPPLTFSEIKAKKNGYESHCDVVVAINKNQLESIGGNVADSVTKTIVLIDANGIIRKTPPTGWSGDWSKWIEWRPWSVIIRNNLS
jgi:hypothetical protein